MLPYALTIFLSAFLLFQVQPLIGKYILPWFGGGPGVWTACLLFFQTLLLAGYAYAHLTSTRLTPRRQATVHLVLLLAALAFLPVAPDEGWKPETGANPAGRILLLLTVTIGLPYLVLSATGPLVQQWFARAQPGRSPYRLYALSNVGSLLALVSYPFVFEPLLARQTQSWFWSAGMVVFAALCGALAWRMRALPDVAPTAVAAAPEEAAEAAPSGGQRALWVALPAVASMLLLATTNKVTQDIAVMPFLWVLPLGLYLVTFILCFDHPRWYHRGVFGALLAIVVLRVLDLLMAGNSPRLPAQVVGYGAALFVACMICHGELYRLRPSSRYLTQFYLLIAAGGALGGFLVAVVAPLLLDRYAELQVGFWLLVYLVGVIALTHRVRVLPLALAAGLALSTIVLPAWRVTGAEGVGGWLTEFGRELGLFWSEHWIPIVLLVLLFAVCLFDRRRGWTREWTTRLGAFPLLLAVALGFVFVVQVGEQDKTALASTRNFYGTLHVFQYNEHEPRTHYLLLRHGGTTHGLQMTMAPQSTWPTTYYGEGSGVGLAIKALPADRPHRLGVVGLGVGTLAAYGREGDYLRIYEINDEVERFARERFTYLADTPAEVEVVLGDARLSMEAELARGQPQRFDVLALDAFSSDAIPVHLLTREAMQVYLEHIAEDGVIAVHISNRYLDLRPVVENLARDLGVLSATIYDEPEEWWNYRTSWVLLTRNFALLTRPEIAVKTEALLPPDEEVGLWTDDYASLFKILK